MTFCQDCADTGVERWTLDMQAGTCTYYDETGKTIHTEYFPK